MSTLRSYNIHSTKWQVSCIYCVFCVPLIFHTKIHNVCQNSIFIRLFPIFYHTKKYHYTVLDYWSIIWIYYSAEEILYFDQPLLDLIISLSSQSFKNILNYVLWGRTYLWNEWNSIKYLLSNDFVIHITCFYHFVTPFYSIDNTLKMNSLIIEVKKGSISTC